MEKLVIEGGKPLSGTIRIHGAKNAALPILAASIMAEGVNIIENVPKLLDIEVMIQILAALGCRAEHHEDRVTLDSTDVRSSHIPRELMTLMRSSIFLMGPLLARTGEVQVYQPGGCAIGTRRIDLHLKGLEALGANIEE
ncbi:MAG: UDP-N-acetylglucosamine 1-carboxyvinyltransferase, partial [Paenibacillaceae bacterium]